MHHAGQFVLFFAVKHADNGGKNEIGHGGCTGFSVSMSHDERAHVQLLPAGSKRGHACSYRGKDLSQEICPTNAGRF